MWALSIRPKFQLHFQKFPVVNGSSCSGTSAKADNLVRYMYAKIFGNFFQWITAPFDFPPRILSWMAPFLYSRVSIFSRNFFSGNLCTIFPHIEIFRICHNKWCTEMGLKKSHLWNRLATVYLQHLLKLIRNSSS